MNTVKRDKSNMNVTNKEFLSALFDDLAPDETCWVAAFGKPPEQATDSNWAGSARLPEAVGSVDLFNQYFSISALERQQSKSATGEVRWGARRDQKHFSRMVCVVLDDAGDADLAPTWKVETSAGNYQLGYRLEDPITDIKVAKRLCKALVAQSAVPNDKSGNNPVRYARLPVGSNTKGGKVFKCELKVWNPERRVTLQELCTTLGIHPETLERDTFDEPKPNATAKVSNPFQSEYQRLGRALRDGDGRYALMTSYIGSKVRAKLSEAEIWRLVEGVIETYFDPEDPPSQKNLRAYRAIIGGLEQKDAAREETETQNSAEINRSPLVQAMVKKADAFLLKQLSAKKDELPPLCAELLNLPYGLGAIQEYVYGRLIYPSRAVAGMTAIAALSALAMVNVKIKSFGGLGANEQYVILSPTGTGKDDIRKALITLIDAATLQVENVNPAGGNLQFNPTGKVGFMRNLPASQQALHLSLQDNKNLLIMADEVGEWFAAAPTNPTRQEALGYMMQVYSSPFGVVAPPQSIVGKYKDVANPRLALFATSTNKRMLEVITSSHLTSGAYNRIVWFVAEERPAKRYEGQTYAIPEEVAQCLGWVAGLAQGTLVEFSAGAWEYYKEHDSKVIEKLTGDPKHGALAGRLSEQAIRMGAMIALSDGRSKIEEGDLRTAYAIRENLHARMFAEMDAVGALSMVEQTPTSKAADKLREQFTKRPSLTLSWMKKEVQDFGARLSASEQEQVVRALVAEGVCAPARQVTRPGRYESLIYQTDE